MSTGTQHSTAVNAPRTQAPFQVHVTPTALAKFNAYATAALPNEIGGLARMEFQRDNGWVFVTDVRVFPQSATPGNFEIDESDITAFMQELIKDGKHDEIGEWCSIIHSHPVGMSAQMSGVDDAALRRFAAEGDGWSFIMPASRESKTTAPACRMHYCTNMMGQQFLLPNLDVKLAGTVERNKLADQMYKYLLGKLKANHTLGEEDMKALESEVKAFMTGAVPHVFALEIEQLKAAAETDVKRFVTTPAPAVRNYGGSQHGGYDTERGVWVPGMKATEPPRTYTHNPNAITDWKLPLKYRAEYRKWMETLGIDEQTQRAGTPAMTKIARLVCWAVGCNPEENYADCGKKKSKKAIDKLTDLVASWEAEATKSADEDALQQRLIEQGGLLLGTGRESDPTDIEVGDYAQIAQTSTAAVMFANKMDKKAEDRKEIHLMVENLTEIKAVKALGEAVVFVNGVTAFWDELTNVCSKQEYLELQRASKDDDATGPKLVVVPPQVGGVGDQAHLDAIVATENANEYNTTKETVQS